jgi:hypothetical protein
VEQQQHYSSPSSAWCHAIMVWYLTNHKTTLSLILLGLCILLRVYQSISIETEVSILIDLSLSSSFKIVTVINFQISTNNLLPLHNIHLHVSTEIKTLFIYDPFLTQQESRTNICV